MRKRLLVLLSVVFLFVLGACGDGKKIEFSLNESEVTLEVGDSHEIAYNLTEGYEIEFSMSEDGIVSITDNTVTALKKGEVTITATVKGKKISKDLKVTVKEKAAQPVTSITVTGDAEGLVGGEITLTATVLPENATDKTVTWTSSDNQLATVVDGKVTLLKAGTVTIKAKAGEKEATHDITIKPILVESVSIAGDVEGFIGDEITLTATVLPENATDKTVTWSSSNEEVATVADGKVTLLKEGVVTITAKAGEKEATHDITVKVKVESITITGDAEGFIGGEITLTATVLPENATDKTVTWSSSNEEVATVVDGKVTLLKVGVVTITAKAGLKEATHDITVKPVLVESVSITGDAEGFVGEEVILAATVLPENATDKTVTWSSSNEEVATVVDGKVTLLKEGVVTITAKAGEKEATHDITVKPVLVESVTIAGEAEGFVGGEIILAATVLPENATDKTVTWTSSDEEIATVVDGKVTLLKEGVVTITAKAGEKEATHDITVKVKAESITISGDNMGIVGKTLTLTSEVLPVDTTNTVVTWHSNLNSLATVENGVVTLLRKGVVTITATIDGISASHEITITDVAAMNGEVEYPSIQMAIDDATAGDIITVMPGEHNEVLTINKAITLKGSADYASIILNRININAGVNGVTIDGFKMTADAQVKNPGQIEDFTFKNNIVYSTNLEASPFYPISRVNVNAIIQLYSLAGTDKVGNIVIDNNTFRDIQSDIISMDRTKVGTTIDITNNNFLNYRVSAIRFDGGYNNGTYNITGNTFENDVKQASGAITFRAYSSSSGNVQVINISNNTFKNIGDEAHNRDGTHPGSAVIGTSTYNSNTIDFNINNNVFINTHNSIHLRKNENKPADVYDVNVSGNVFQDTTGYVYFEDGNVAVFESNTFKDRLGVEVAADRIIYTEETDYRMYTIADPVFEDFEITGDTAGEIGDQIQLELTATPPYFLLKDVEWTSSDTAIATVKNGVVKLISEGTVTITATYGDVSKTHDISITKKVVAMNGMYAYYTIQEAIDAAAEGDTITVSIGSFDEVLTIDKALVLKGSPDHTSTLLNLININSGVNGVTIDGFNMTAKAQVKNPGLIENFKFINNIVFETELASSGYTPNTRVNVNAVIQLYSLAGTDKVGNILIDNNIFRDIQSDIISMDRTKVGTTIDITNNQFLNYSVGAIRFDGGYNNGTYNITGNTFENDIKGADAAIVFRAYSSSAGNVQTININDNTFKNIGNVNNNPTDLYPASAVIATSTYNDKDIVFSIKNNLFINTHNSIHLRKNSSVSAAVYNVEVSGNTFKNPTGYMYREDGNLVNYHTNVYQDKDGSVLPVERYTETNTQALTMVKMNEIRAEYVILTYTYNKETEVYDVAEEVKTGVVGTQVRIIPQALEGYYTDQDVYTGEILEDGSLVIVIYYHEITVDPNAFYYKLVLNGGNLAYESRDALVRDFIRDYNTVNGKSYTLETLGMSIWGDVDYHEVFYHEIYRDKWLWLADYLGEVGSNANRQSARDILTLTKAQWNAKSGDWKYAFSYEVRAFLKGIHFTENANWSTSDYSIRELAFGFWDKYASYMELEQYLSSGATETLPIPYLEGYDFAGWYRNPEFTGEVVTEITSGESVETYYAKYDEKNPMTGLEITNVITTLQKGLTHQLELTITPSDTYNKLLIYYTSDNKVAIVSETGLITALNAGEVTIRVTNYNGLVEATMTFTVIPGDDITLDFNGHNGFVEIDDVFNISVSGFGSYEGETFTFVVGDPLVLELTEGNKFKALTSGSTDIQIKMGEEVIYTHHVIVQEALGTDRVDKLLKILSDSHIGSVQGINVIPYHQADKEWSDPRYESVNMYLFDAFEVNRTDYLADPDLKSSGLMPSVEFVVVHDTANLNGGLISHGNFFQNPANPVSVHYTVGDYGILQTLDEGYIAWHAGDGTTVPFEWLDTGITATGDEKPEIDLSEDGYFTFNGVKSTVLAPKDGDKILNKNYFTYYGPTWTIKDGKYHVGTHWFTRGQQTHGVIASHGGNRNGIGIEMNVNTNADIIDTVQRTAKLVANILEDHNLPSNRVVTHNTMDGKGDSYTLNNTVYNGTYYYDRFMEYVEVEREILKNYSDATITFSSESEYLSQTGRVIKMPETTVEVEYTITVTIGEVTKSITLVSVIQGKNTWNQHSGFFRPTQFWAKAGYRE